MFFLLSVHIYARLKEGKTSKNPIMKIQKSCKKMNSMDIYAIRFNSDGLSTLHLAGEEEAGCFNCVVAVCVVCLFLAMKWVGLRSVIWHLLVIYSYFTVLNDNA